MLLVVPNYVSDSINAAIDAELAGRPCDDESRRHIYEQLLLYFDEHGMLPDFSLTPSTTQGASP